jgi:hypothetical protein
LFIAIQNSLQIAQNAGSQDDKNPAHCSAGMRQTAENGLVKRGRRVARGQADAECPIWKGPLDRKSAYF